MRETAVRTIISRGFRTATIALLFGFGQGFHEQPAEAQSTSFSNAKEWLDQAVREKHCPLTPVNVPRTILKTTSSDVLQQRITIDQDTLQIEGTPNPDHILIRAGETPGAVRVVFNGKDIGSFGPVARILVQSGDGDDVLVVEPGVGLPVRLEGGSGDNCLQSGSGGDLLLSGPGNDVLIAGTGRPALDAGPGVNRVVVPQSMGELWVAPSANGELLRQIGTIYTLQPLPQGPDEPSQGSPNPIILGPSDLADASIVPLLQQTYAAGQSIAVTNATTEDGARLRALLGHPNAAETPSSGERAALIFFRKAPRPGTNTNDYSTGIFGHPFHAREPSMGQQSDEYTIELLSRVFSATAIVPEAPSDTPANDITVLANSYTSSATSSGGIPVKIENTLWGVRSFSIQSDYYLVKQSATYGLPEGAPVFFGFADSQIYSLPVPPTVVQTSPQSALCFGSTTSSVGAVIGGGGGWNQTQGVNAEVSGDIDISNSETFHCPFPYEILDAPNLSDGFLYWQYQTLAGASGSGGTLSFINQWIWGIPWTSYSNGQKDISVGSEARSKNPCGLYFNCSAGLTSSVPLPFDDTFALQKPTVLSVSPTCVNEGSTFTINGTGMYPSLVTSVLINAVPLEPPGFKADSDTSITVVAPIIITPGQSSYFLPVAVQTVEGLSNSNISIEISTNNCQ
jgi:hypothetical protein